MIKQSPKSRLAISLIAAIMISGSFCLHLLTMTALAATPTAAVPSATRPGSMVATPAASACCADCDRPAERTINESSGVPMLNCCTGQTINPTITTASPDIFSHLLVATLTPLSASIITNPIGVHYYQTVILSPPQTVALRSIVKLE